MAQVGSSIQKCNLVHETKNKHGSLWCVSHAQWVRKCEMCGETMHSKRRHTKTCSDKCRKAKSRADRLHNASKKAKERTYETKWGRADAATVKRIAEVLMLPDGSY